MYCVNLSIFLSLVSSIASDRGTKETPDEERQGLNAKKQEKTNTGQNSTALEPLELSPRDGERAS